VRVHHFPSCFPFFPLRFRPSPGPFGPRGRSRQDGSGGERERRRWLRTGRGPGGASPSPLGGRAVGPAGRFFSAMEGTDSFSLLWAIRFPLPAPDLGWPPATVHQAARPSPVALQGRDPPLGTGPPFDEPAEPGGCVRSGRADRTLAALPFNCHELHAEERAGRRRLWRRRSPGRACDPGPVPRPAMAFTRATAALSRGPSGVAHLYAVVGHHPVLVVDHWAR